MDVEEKRLWKNCQRLPNACLQWIHLAFFWHRPSEDRGQVLRTVGNVRYQGFMVTGLPKWSGSIQPGAAILPMRAAPPPRSSVCLRRVNWASHGRV